MAVDSIGVSVMSLCSDWEVGTDLHWTIVLECYLLVGTSQYRQDSCSIDSRTAHTEFSNRQ